MVSTLDSQWDVATNSIFNAIPRTATINIRRNHVELIFMLMWLPINAPTNITKPRTMPSFQSTMPRQKNTSVATPDENKLTIFVVATDSNNVMPKKKTNAAVNMVT